MNRPQRTQPGPHSPNRNRAPESRPDAASREPKPGAADIGCPATGTRQVPVAEFVRPTRRRFPPVLFSASKAPRRPMKASPNIPSRNHAVSRTPALELGGFSRDPMKRASAPVSGSSSPLRRLSIAISLGIAAQHPAGVLVRSDPKMPSGTSMKRLAVKRRASRGFDPGDPPLASFRP